MLSNPSVTNCYSAIQPTGKEIIYFIFLEENTPKKPACMRVLNNILKSM